MNNSFFKNQQLNIKKQQHFIIGDRVGIFASRAPYRPNPIGITVAKLESIEKKNGNVILHLSGIDLVDSTPILDIKYVKHQKK